MRVLFHGHYYCRSGRKLRFYHKLPWRAPTSGARFVLASWPWNRPRGPNKGVPRPSPAAAGRVGRGGARERAQFSPSGGNGDKRTQGELVRRAKRRWPGPLRRRWGAPNGAYKRFVPRTKPWRKGGSAALSISIPTGPRKMEHFAGPIPWPSSPLLWPETEILPQVLLAGPHTGGPLFCAPPGAAGGFSRKIHPV